MRLSLLVAALALLGIALSAGQDVYADVARWAVAEQRAFQNEMAAAVRALRTGRPDAWLALLAAAGAYGFVHALGPGHGKFVLGGVGLGSAVSAPRLLGVALVSSLVQALWAILLVYGGFFLLEASAAQVTALAEDYLAPGSYLAIAVIGAVLAWRGTRALWRRATPRAATQARKSCGCHAHGPAPEAVARLGSPREAVALILGIAMRPCTGALFLLVIAWQMDIALAGAAAVVVMGLGVAALTGLVAVSSVAARGLAHASSGRLGVMTVAAPSLQVVAGLSIVWFAVALLRLGGP
ncbi:MAG: nickel/cobalt transporter [Paracoccaceae bacterium]